MLLFVESRQSTNKEEKKEKEAALSLHNLSTHRDTLSVLTKKKKKKQRKRKKESTLLEDTPVRIKPGFAPFLRGD